MDAYHQVLTKLLEVTDGRDSKAVNFKDLVKSLGFHGNYFNIFQHLSEEGWIAEDVKADFVRITHWGVAEAKKSLASGGEKRKTSENAKKALSSAKELVVLLEELVKNFDSANLGKAVNKLSETEKSLDLAKKDL